MSKRKIALVFGGRSQEHEVSLMSVKNVWKGLDSSKYEKVPFAITKQGTWMTPENSTRYLFENNEAVESAQPISSAILHELLGCDLAFPVMHGPYCEDGTLQGFFETLNIPYVASSHMACSAAMDKTLAKQVFVANNLHTAPFLFFTKKEWNTDSKKWIDETEKKLSYPLFVKPAYLGSSVGLSRVTNQKALVEAIELALSHNDKVLIEEEVVGRELEFPVIGNESLTVYPPGEVLKGDDFYHFDGKYGENGIKVSPKAELDPEVLDMGKEIAKQAYRAIGCSVYARCDFFLDSKNQWWINEINPIPGFTNISLLPLITSANGLALPQLLDQLITLSSND